MPLREKGTRIEGEGRLQERTWEGQIPTPPVLVSGKWPSQRRVQLLGRFPVQISQWFASQNPSVGPSALHAGTWAEGSQEKPTSTSGNGSASESQRLLGAHVLSHSDLEKGPSLPAGYCNHQVIRKFPFLCTQILHCDLERTTFTTREIYYIKLMA